MALALLQTTCLEVILFRNLRQHMLIVQDVVKTTKIFGGDGNPKRECLTCTAEKLCIGGACYYLFPEELTSNEVEAGQSMTGMLKTFIFSNVVPNIRKRLSNSAALVLGKALLCWLIYSPYDATHNLVPQEMKNRIQMEWNEIALAGDSAVDSNLSEYNPIRLVPVVVTGNHKVVFTLTLCLLLMQRMVE